LGSTYTPSVTYGGIYVATPCSVTIDNTQVTCTSVSGVGKDLTLVLSIGGRPSDVNPSVKLTYMSPSISKIEMTGVSPTTGGQPFVITGFNLGNVISQVSIRYGPTDVGVTKFLATDCTIVTPHTSITCKSAPGIGINLQYTITVAGLTSLLSSSSTQYGGPTVASLKYPSGGLDTKGGETVTITGSGYGPFVGEYSWITATYAGASGTALTSVGCAIVSQTEATCRSVEGVGKLHQWVITVAKQVSAAGPVTPIIANSYIPPSITSVTTSTAWSTTGGTLFTLIGVQFGPPPNSPSWQKLGAYGT
jgi:hypothetical protein